MIAAWLDKPNSGDAFQEIIHHDILAIAYKSKYQTVTRKEARQLTSKPRWERIHIFLVLITKIDLGLRGNSPIARPLAVGFTMNGPYFHERSDAIQ